GLGLQTDQVRPLAPAVCLPPTPLPAGPGQPEQLIPPIVGLVDVQHALDHVHADLLLAALGAAQRARRDVQPGRRGLQGQPAHLAGQHPPPHLRSVAPAHAVLSPEVTLRGEMMAGGSCGAEVPSGTIRRGAAPNKVRAMTDLTAAACIIAGWPRVLNRLLDA